MAHDPHNQLIPPHEIDHYDRLFQAEASFMADPNYVKNDRAATIRRNAVASLEDYSKSKCQDFDAFVPYLAMTYFDRLISRHDIMTVLDDEEKNKDLFVICCLTIAWKMRTKSFKVPEFLETEKKDYELIAVMNMELFILNQLEWRMRSLTPICFAEYFISLMPQGDQINSTRRLVHQILLTSQADIRTTKFKPSLVAASVVSAISLQQFPTQSSRFEAALSRCQYVVGRELSSCKKALKHICKAKLESLMSQSAEEESSGQVSGSGVGTSAQASGSGVGTSEAAEASSSSAASQPVSAEIGKLSKPMQIGGAPAGTIEPPAVKSTLSNSLLQASMPPGGTADDNAGKQPMGEIQPEPTPAPAGTKDPQLDFELDWIKYVQELQPKSRGSSLLDKLTECSTSCSASDTTPTCCFIL